MARGRKTGGRKKGTPNKRTIAQKEIIASGMSPLDFLCAVYRNPKQPMNRRIEAARCAAPYFHAKLAATVYTPPQEQLGDGRIELVFVPGPGNSEDESTKSNGGPRLLR
jgi:hypothetical protein